MRELDGVHLGVVSCIEDEKNEQQAQKEGVDARFNVSIW